VIQAFGDDALSIMANNPKLNETIRTALGQGGLTAEEQATVHQLDFLNFVTQNWEDASDRMSLLNSQGPTGTPQRAAIDGQFDKLLQIAANSLPEEQAARFRERFSLEAPVVAPEETLPSKGPAQTTLAAMIEQHPTIARQGEDKVIIVTEPGIKRPAPNFEIRDGLFHCTAPYAEFAEPMTPAQFQAFVERMAEQGARLEAELAAPDPA